DALSQPVFQPAKTSKSKTRRTVVIALRLRLGVGTFSAQVQSHSFGPAHGQKPVTPHAENIRFNFPVIAVRAAKLRATFGRPSGRKLPANLPSCVIYSDGPTLARKSRTEGLGHALDILLS